MFPYRHRIAIEAPWLLDVLERAVTSYRNDVTVQWELGTDDRRTLTRELCQLDAALTQLITERNHHARTCP